MESRNRAHVEFANDFDLLLSTRSLYLIRRMFAPVAGLLFGLWGCYPAKLLFGLLQLRSKALDENIMLCSHITSGFIIISMSRNECWIQGWCVTLRVDLFVEDAFTQDGKRCGVYLRSVGRAGSLVCDAKKGGLAKTHSSIHQ